LKSFAIVTAAALLVTMALLLKSHAVHAASPAEEASPPTVFVFVKVPENILPIARGEKYEDPLDHSLKQAHFGEVTGGGSQLSAPDKDGRRSVEWVGLDVEISDLQRGLALLKSELKRLGVHRGSTLEYSRDGKKVEEPIW